MGIKDRFRALAITAPNTNGPLPGGGTPDLFDASEIGGVFHEPVEPRGAPVVAAAPWEGLPNGWNPTFTQAEAGISKLVDIAWAALDLNSSILSSLPAYVTRGNKIIQPPAWLTNPDPTTYTSWDEFAKQLFWDYQMGEAFVLPMGFGSNQYPSAFRVIPPWMMNVEMRGGIRHYMLGALDVTSEILHIRYKSTTDNPRGTGPLDHSKARLTSLKLLQRYTDNIAQTGGIPQYWIGTERRLQLTEAKDLLAQWIETRSQNAGHPAVLGSGATLNQAKSMSAHDMALMELTEYSESRISTMFGVPPFLLGLSGTPGNLTYSNITDLFDFHDRSSLRPKSRAVMEGLSGWVLPHGTSADINRDDYTRPGLLVRYQAYQIAILNGILTPEQVQEMERLMGTEAAGALTGGIY